MFRVELDGTLNRLAQFHAKWSVGLVKPGPLLMNAARRPSPERTGHSSPACLTQENTKCFRFCGTSPDRKNLAIRENHRVRSFDLIPCDSPLSPRAGSITNKILDSKTSKSQANVRDVVAISAEAQQPPPSVSWTKPQPAGKTQGRTPG